MLPRLRSFVSPFALLSLASGLEAAPSPATLVQQRTSSVRNPSLALPSSSAPQVPLQAAACASAWLPTFGGAPSLLSNVESMLAVDLGAGPQLYLGGLLYRAGGGACSGIVGWDGMHWSDLAGGVAGVTHPEVFALCVFDDGSGPALYVGGDFLSAGGLATDHLARWDGQQWSAVGAGTDGVVRCLRVFDDGSGPALYVAGDFVTAGGISANRIARWDGTSFTALGSGTGNSIRALEVFDDGSGRALYATGSFSTAGGQLAQHIARWNGASWSPVGMGFPASGYALTVHDDGSGRALYVGYSGTGPLGAASPGIARWNATGWQAVGIGVAGAVECLLVFDDGTGAKLYAGGELPALATPRLECWDGAQWSDLSNGLSAYRCQSLESFDDGHGPSLFVGGYLGLAAPLAGAGVVRRTGSSWSPVSDGGLDAGVRVVAALDDGSGTALFAGGDFGHAGDLGLAHVGRWNGSSWQPLGAGLDGTVLALAGFDDGGGWALYAGGDFVSSGGSSARGLARWNGSAWTPVGGAFDGSVRSLCVHDDGSGPALFASGSFTRVGQVSALHCARWNGSTWSALGSGLAAGASSLVSFDDGGGARLYAAAGASVLRWDGAGWTSVGQSDGSAVALCAHDDGGGRALYLGGWFHSIDGVTVTKVARWRGGAWTTTNFQPWVGEVEALLSLATLEGPRLIAGGGFSIQGSGPGNGIAQWDGTSWTALGSGVAPYYGPKSMTVFDDGSGPALIAGGAFGFCLDSRDSYLAKWGVPAGCTISGSVLCEPGAAGVSACPCSNPAGGPGRGCDNSARSGGVRLVASGVASLAHDTLVFSASGAPANALSIVLQSDTLQSAGASFGQGVSCLAGSIRRLYLKQASVGVLHAPGANDPSVSARSAALGDVLAPNARRSYAVAYRDALVLGGCPATSTFNSSAVIGVLWGQ